MICYNCGNEVTTQGANCPFCGSPLSPASGNQPNYNQTQYQQNYQQGQYQQGYYQNQYNHQSYSMDPRSAGIVCYITLIGFLVACICADKNDPFLKCHLNNAAGLIIFGFISGAVCVIPIIGWLFGIVASIYLFICWIIGIVSAISGEMKELPIINSIKVF